MSSRVRFVAELTSEVDLAIIIVGYNVRALTLKNIETLLESEGEITARIILVDNCSKDDTAAVVKATFPVVHVIQNERNVGFSRAVNQGIAVSSARHVLLLNPDMRVTQDAIARFVAYADAHPAVGVIGGKLLTDGDYFKDATSYSARVGPLSTNRSQRGSGTGC